MIEQPQPAQAPKQQPPKLKKSPPAPAATAESALAGEVERLAAEVKCLSAQVERLTRYQADAGARQFCLEVINGMRNSTKLDDLRFVGGTSKATYELMRDRTDRLLREAPVDDDKPAQP